MNEQTNSFEAMSKQTGASAEVVLKDLLSVDDLHNLRDKLHYMGMEVIVNEGDQTSRSDLYSAVNSIDYILEALERVQKP